MSKCASVVTVMECSLVSRVEFSGLETPYACDGRYRIRRADEDIVTSRAKLAEMMRESENRSNPWSSRSSGKPVPTVDEEMLRRYVERDENGRLYSEIEAEQRKL